MNNNDLIFITNDDGYNSKGIIVLKQIAKSLTDQVWTFAPSSNNSGKSHAITINKKIKIKSLGNNTFKVEGTPVDCVIAGNKYLSIKKLKPSLILSGINFGQNLGLDILYSGTFAAAREGSLHGVQSFSISLEKNKKPSNWNTVKFFLPIILQRIRNLKIKENVCYNINFPNTKISKVRGCKIVKSGKRKPGELLEFSIVSKKSSYIKIPSERKVHTTAVSNEDEYEMKKKFITVTYHSNISFHENKIHKKLSDSIGKIIEK